MADETTLPVPCAALLVLGALTALGCGTDVAQTAELTPSGGIACPAPSTPPALPDAPELGGGSTASTSELAQGSYGVGQGPGIALAARDVFRLFVNGELLAESTRSLETRFVPLTLLPGENVLAVVVTAESADPALLLELEELERAYTTGSNWKVSAEPSGDWMLPDYDDGAWASALDHGGLLENPRCRPSAGFPSSSAAHWIGSSVRATSVAFRQSVRVEPTGYAAGTSGGAGAVPALANDVETLAELLEDPEPRIVLLAEGLFDARRPSAEVTESLTCPTDCPDGSGMITHNVLTGETTCPTTPVPMPRNERRLDVGSDKTLVGLGRGALLRGVTLNVGASQNVIVRNVALFDVNPGLIEAGDAISVEGAAGLWVDHVTFKWISDGFIDVSIGANGVGATDIGGSGITASWLRFDGENAAACQSRHPRSNEMANALATFHHNAWLHVNGRAPLATHPLARVHLYNNLVSDDVDYAVGAGCDAEVLLESSVFESVRIPTSKRACTDGSVGVGAIDAGGRGNVYGSGVGSHEDGGVASPEPSDPVTPPPYEIELEPTSDLGFRIGERAGAGSRWALPLELD